MVAIVTRAGKGSPLTNVEVDANFTNLNVGKLELGQAQSGAVANSVLFFNGSSVVSSGSSLTFNGTNFGIGTGSPEFNFHVVGSVDPVALALDGYGPGNPAFITRKALGTVEAPSALTNNAALFTFGGRGYRATGWSPATNVSIVGRATEDWSNTATGARLEFGVTQNGTTSRLSRFILDHDGSAQFSANIASTSALTGTLVVTGGVGVSGSINASGSVTATTFNGALSGNASTATALQNSRTLWGQSFNGTANITAPLLPAAGSVSAPAFSVTGDVDTGIYFPAADTLGVTIGGVEAARFNSSRNLLIGGTLSASRTASFSPFGDGTDTNFAAVSPGTAQGQLAGYSFRPTFMGTTDNVPRRSADIWSGFSGGAWGNEFLAIGVGNNGAQNDTALTTAEKLRILSSGTVFLRDGSSTVNTNNSRLVVGGTISETVSNVQMLVVSQTDVGTAPNQLPLNQYLGNLAYQNADAIAGNVGVAGRVLIGTTELDGLGGLSLSPLASMGAAQIAWNRTANASTSIAAVFYTAGVSSGGIIYGDTTTTFVTSSDHRLKENVRPMSGALSKVSALKPVTYTWKVNGSPGQGFIAHELQEVVPECVTGEKDAVDADGKPIYQGVDASFLVATLAAAIQEQQAIIEQLMADVSALKAG